MRYLFGINRFHHLYIHFCKVFLFISYAVQAQDGLFPYSNFGLGEVIPLGSVRNMGMGNVGISTAHPFYGNLKNPAALVYNKFTLFDFSISGDWIDLQNQEIRVSSYTGRINHFNLIFPISPQLSTRIGLRRAIQVDYLSATLERIPNSPAYALYNLSGSGGIRQAYLGIGMQIVKNFSLGINLIYNFGMIVKSEQSEVLVGSRSTTIGYTNHFNFKELTLDAGLLYDIKLPKNKILHIGLTYIPSFNYNFTYSQRIDRNSINGVNIFSDTLINQNRSVRLPPRWGLGLSISKGLIYSIGIDFIFERWSIFKGLIDSQNSIDTYQINLGSEWTPDSYTLQFFKKLTYRIGFSYSLLPWKINNRTINEWSVTMGFSIPLKKFSLLNYAISYHKRFTKAIFVDMQYIRLNFGIVINDQWFIKRKFN